MTSRKVLQVDSSWEIFVMRFLLILVIEFAYSNLTNGQLRHLSLFPQIPTKKKILP